MVKTRKRKITKNSSIKHKITSKNKYSIYVNKTYYYHRDNMAPILPLNVSSNKDLKVGDEIKMHGNLYSDQKYKNKVATSKTVYSIIFTSKKGTLLNVTHIYNFCMENTSFKGQMIFKGRFFTDNLTVENSKLLPYSYASPVFCIFEKGTLDFKYGSGFQTITNDINKGLVINIIINIYI